jgi:hypothetical protein
MFLFGGKMFRILMISLLTTFVSCYGNNSDLYSKEPVISTIHKTYDVDKIDNNIVVLVSKDLKNVKKIKKSFFKKEIKEGYQVTYIDGEIYVSKNKKLKAEISKILFDLSPENKKLSLKL